MNFKFRYISDTTGLAYAYVSARVKDRLLFDLGTKENTERFGCYVRIHKNACAMAVRT